MKTLAELVLEARTRHDFTQAEVAQRIGQDPSWVSRLETGRMKEPPTPEAIRAIWRVLGISMRTQLESLGYLDPEEMEPGVAYVIREDDPRTKVLALLEGASPTRVAGVAEVVRLFFLHSTSGQSDINSEDRQDRDQSDSA